MNKIWRYGLVAMLFVAAALFGYQMRSILVPIMGALILAYILEPIVVYLEAHRFTRVGATLAIYLLLFCIIAAFGLLGLPRLWQQILRAAELIPLYNEQLQNVLNQAAAFCQQFALPSVFSEMILGSLDQLEIKILALTARLMENLLSLLSHSLDIVLIPVLGFYFLKDKDFLQRQLWQLIPVKNRQEVTVMLRQMDYILRGFLSGSLTVGFCVALMVSAGLLIIGMDLPLLFGMIAGVFNVIPYFGAIIGMAPAVIFASFTSLKMAVSAATVMILAQQIESNLITPKIIGEKIGVHPIGVMIALLIGGKLWGIMGMLFAVPTAGLLKIALEFLYEKIIALSTEKI